MRIISMTATFGSLEGKTLSFQPGLNILCAPNEWGKSTWCAFLMAMLYGIDTKQRTKQGSIADKERYLPWSGKPMSGTLRVLWRGRDITMERYTQGRIPMGKFRAYETESGVEVSELTGDNCGAVLLGVERGTYARSGFISDSSMVVSSDADLSRRLNQLVTAGDDSPVAVNLERQLKDLKNKCQYNRSGLLPQAREALEQCRRELINQENLGNQAALLQKELDGTKNRLEELLNHQKVLEAAENREKLAHVAQARQEEQEAAILLRGAEEQCEKLPTAEELRHGLRELEKLQQERETLEMDAAMTEPVENVPVPPPFAGLTPQEAADKADRDVAELEELAARAEKGGGAVWFVLSALIALLGVAGRLLLTQYIPWWVAVLSLVLGVVFLCLGLSAKKQRSRAKREVGLCRRGLETEYKGNDPVELARAYVNRCREAEEKKLQHDSALEQARQELCRREKALGVDERVWRKALELREQYVDAQRRFIRAEKHRKTMELMASGLAQEQVQSGSSLHLTMEQTRSELILCRNRITELRSRLDRCLGESRALPEREDLMRREQQLAKRVKELEKWYAAITCAQEALGQAQRELQSRFAPKISQNATRYLSSFTGGKYGKLLLQEDFSLLSAGEGETVNHESRWRSTGTREQMYLALRLAVADALLPDAPLILDDALVRFDDQRAGEVLKLLEKQDRQVILFSCQEREKNLAAHLNEIRL